MPKKVKPIPEGYHTITPFLSIKDAAKAIKFYQNAFGAKVVEQHDCPDGKVMHAVIKIGDSMIMLADEFPQSECNLSSPKSVKGTTCMLHVYVEDVDAAFNKAVKAGAKVQRPVTDMFWGDRYGQLEDPFGHLWSISTHIADKTDKEIAEGAKQCMGKKK